MKKRAFVMAGLLALSIMAMTQVALAQDSMVVNIPFEFVAGKATLPPGEYIVQAPESRPAIFLIHRSIPHASVVLMTNSAESRDPQQSASKLVFNCYGNRRFLSQVWKAGYSQGKQLPKSPREKELSRVASNETKSEVTLVARLTPAKP
jgi:hypothetical protein